MMRPRRSRTVEVACVDSEISLHDRAVPNVVVTIPLTGRAPWRITARSISAGGVAGRSA